MAGGARQATSRRRSPGKYRVGDIRHCFADISAGAAACSATSPQVTLDDGLVELAEWLQRPGRPRIASPRPARELAARGLTRMTPQTRTRPSRRPRPDHRRRRVRRHQRRRPAARDGPRACASSTTCRAPASSATCAGCARSTARASSCRSATFATARRSRRAVARRRSQVFHFAAQVAVTTSLDRSARRLRRQRARHAQPARGDARARRSRRRLMFTSTNKVYGDLDDVPARRPTARRYVPADRDVAERGIGEDAAARLPQPLRLLERRGGPVRARLRAHLRIAGGRVSHELHLRPAPVRHRRPGLGRALPDPGAATASRSRSTATACRCATSCSSTIWSTRCCSRRQHMRRICRAGLQHRRRPGEHRQPARTARPHRRADRRAPALAFEPWRAGRSALLRLGHAPLQRGDRAGAPQVRRRARACERCIAWLRESRRPRTRSSRRHGWRHEVRAGQPAVDVRGQHLLRLPRAAPAARVRLCAGAARARRARGAARSTRSCDDLPLERGARSACAAFEPDLTVVTTAPSYLFWRCAPPELRVPAGNASRALRRRARSSIVVGPHALDDAGDDACASWAPMSRCMGECEEIAAAARRGDRADWQHRLDRLARRRRRVRVQGGAARGATWRRCRRCAGPTRRCRAASRTTITASMRRRPGPGAEMEASRGCPYHCTFCAKDNFRDDYRKRPLAVDPRRARRPDRRRASSTSTSSTRSSCRTATLLRGARRAADVSSACRRASTSGRTTMLDLLGRAGCVSIEAGVESITVEGRNLLDKGSRLTTERDSPSGSFTPSSTSRSCRPTCSIGYRRPADVEAGAQHLQQLGVWANKPVPMFPYPGSPGLHEAVGRAGRSRLGARAGRTTSRSSRVQRHPGRASAAARRAGARWLSDAPGRLSG